MKHLQCSRYTPTVGRSLCSSLFVDPHDRVGMAADSARRQEGASHLPQLPVGDGGLLETPR